MPFNKQNIRVTVPRKSGFDKSHRNTGTLNCGSLTPLLCDELIPGSRVSLRINLASQLPPLASDTYMNVKLKTEAFFVPMRLCCGSFEDFFCDVPREVLTKPSDPDEFSFKYGSKKFGIPTLTVGSDYASLIGRGSLADYLGVRVNGISGAEGFVNLNPMPFVAYHLIWQEWYRNPRVQKPCFVAPFDDGDYKVDNPISAMPFTKYSEDQSFYETNQNSLASDYLPDLYKGSLYLANGKTIFDFEQRNFPLDYFTSARVAAQQGDPVKFDVPLSGADAGKVSMAAVRAANSMQLFKERNNLPSPRLVDQVKARYGANLSDGVAQRPICIGTGTYDVASTGISQTGEVSEGANPFNSVAAQYGRAYASGSDFIIKDFTANEPGYLIVLVSLVPEATYSNGIDPLFNRYLKKGSIVEMATPLLQNMGDQPITVGELTGTRTSQDTAVFGFTDRFADFMFKPNTVHGLMAEGQNLAAFVLQRAFNNASAVELSSEFLEIPTDYLDGVLAVSAAIAGCSAWYDAYLDYKVSMPLAEFSIPSLQDPAYEHGQSVVLRRNGQIF